MNHRLSYPSSVSEVIDDDISFRPATLEAVRRFTAFRPWRGAVEERKAKFAALHANLCGIYGKFSMLTFGVLDGSFSGDSSYCPSTDTITLRGRLSVVTYLHEFAHALGSDERGA